MSNLNVFKQVTVNETVKRDAYVAYSSLYKGYLTPSREWTPALNKARLFASKNAINQVFEVKSKQASVLKLKCSL